jgi:hypothetical protein
MAYDLANFLKNKDIFYINSHDFRFLFFRMENKENEIRVGSYIIHWSSFFYIIVKKIYVNFTYFDHFQQC